MALVDKKQDARERARFSVRVLRGPSTPNIMTVAHASQPPAPRCFECNFFYGPLLPYIHSVMDMIQRAFVDKTHIMPVCAQAIPGGNIAIGDVLDALKIMNDCCRRIFTMQYYIGERLYAPAAAAAESSAAEDTPAEDSPAEDTPAEDSPAEDTPAEDSPAEDSPAEDSPAEDSPAET